MKRLFDKDDFQGITEIFHYDELTGNAYIETLQNVQPILDENKALQNDDDFTKKGIKHEFWKYAKDRKSVV